MATAVGGPAVASGKVAVWRLSRLVRPIFRVVRRVNKMNGANAPNGCQNHGTQRHTAARSGEKTGGGELPISRLISVYIKAERGRGTLDTSGRGDGPGSERCECVGFGTAVKKRIGCVE